MEWGTLAAWLAFLAPRLNKRKSRFNGAGVAGSGTSYNTPVKKKVDAEKLL